MDTKTFKELQNSFSITIYEINSKFNDISSKGRARIFYKGLNRNATYITEEFAAKLLATLPYTPVKGIWDEVEGDFTDHGRSRTEGKIYGIVLGEPNISWETFTDKDGVERTYACADVIIYDEIYPEAKKIIGKSLSMELLPSTIEGRWVMENGCQYFEFTSGSFAGLQALGEEVEPCFEGAQFFSLINDINKLKELCDKIEQYNLSKGGQTEMPKINFKLSDQEKYDLIWQALNSEYNEESGWIVTCGVQDVYEDYALCYEYESKEYFRQYYTKTEEGGIELGERKKCYVVDLTEEENIALQAIAAVGYTQVAGNLEELKAQNETYAATLAEKDAAIEEYTSTIEGLNSSISQKDTEISDYTAQIAEKDSAIEALNGQVAELTGFKYGVEKAQKESILEKYSLKLDDEVISNYTSNLDNYKVEDLEKELSYELVKATPSIFSKEVNPVIPKDDGIPTGIEAILNKYK